MEIVVAKADLMSALSFTSPCLGKAPTTDDGKADPVKVIASHCLFRHKDGRVEILTQDGAKLSASAILVGCTVKGDEGSFTIDGRKLIKWLTYASDAAITLVSKKSTVSVTAPAGTVTFDSLDPKSFPFWDAKLASAEVVKVVPAAQFRWNLGYVSKYISKQDTTHPTLATTAMYGGALFSTDRGAVCMIVIPGMEASTMRLHGKHAGPVLSFLQSLGSADVTILEEEWTVFFKADGCTMGVSKPGAKFPQMKVNPDEEFPAKWSMPIEALRRAIGMVKAAAADDDNDVTFTLDGDQAMVGMKASKGNRANSIAVDLIEHSGDGTIPEAGFVLHHDHLSSLLSNNPGDNIDFLIKEHADPKKKTGYTRIVWDVDGCKVITVCMWQ